MIQQRKTTNIFRFHLDGVEKAMLQPVTGEALYVKAGDPAEIITSDGLVIERNEDILTFDSDTVELITQYRLSPTSRLNPEP
jgi:hypothetical protein